MKKTILTRLSVIALALVLLAALSAAAFADGPQNGRTQDSMQMGQQFGGQRGGFDQGQQGGQRGGFDQGQQGGFGQNGPMGGRQDGQQPAENPEGDDTATPDAFGRGDGRMGRGGRGHMDGIFSAVEGLEDETVRENIENLMQACRDAMDAVRSAEDDEARAAAIEAETAAQEALEEALAAAGIEWNARDNRRQPPELPENGAPAPDQPLPEDGAPAPELPPERPEDGQDTEQLFRQFMDWWKENNEA